MSETIPTEGWRLFIAVRMPEEVKTEVERTQAELRRAAPEAGVRWSKREQFHLTLKFLGDVKAQDFGPLAEAIRGACRGFAPMKLRAQGIGFFPDARFPRVVWAGIHGPREELPGLQSAVAAAARPFTVEKEKENFTGHVTLGRVKRLRRPEAEALARRASGMAEKFFGEWAVNEVEIIRSELSPKGALHTTIGVVPLTASG